MKNPFIAMVLAVVARKAALMNHLRIQPLRLPEPKYSYHGRNGMTVAALKRAAVKAKNRAKHRAHCRGAR